MNHHHDVALSLMTSFHLRGRVGFEQSFHSIVSVVFAQLESLGGFHRNCCRSGFVLRSPEKCLDSLQRSFFVCEGQVQNVQTEITKKSKDHTAITLVSVEACVRWAHRWSLLAKFQREEQVLNVTPREGSLKSDTPAAFRRVAGMRTTQPLGTQINLPTSGRQNTAKISKNCSPAADVLIPISKYSIKIVSHPPRQPT